MNIAERFNIVKDSISLMSQVRPGRSGVVSATLVVDTRAREPAGSVRG